MRASTTLRGQFSVGSGILPFILALFAFTLLSVLWISGYLPISSTSELAEINGLEQIKKHVVDPILHPNTLIPINNRHKVIPTKQLSIRYETRPHPSVQPLPQHQRASGAMAARFRSLVPYKIRMFYEDGRGGSPQGHLQLGGETTTNSYAGHVFFFTPFGNPNKEIARVKMIPEQNLYIIEDEENPAPQALVDATKKELEFMNSYFERTGILWRHYYGPNGPRPPPVLYMWPANQVGEVHAVTTSNGYWTCRGTAEECHSVEPLHLELEVISTAPRAFVINDFFNEFEADEIVHIGRSGLKASSVGDYETGAFESTTRTSLNTWLSRSTSPMIDTLFRRAADLLQIDESLLTRGRNAEDMQLVHYVNGQKYDAHHDWGVHGRPESRYITLLLYLTDMVSPDAGCETSFPKADNEKGIKIHPGKGNAVLFYDLLPDGNGDDLSLHAALPCMKGEKWLANFWVWDPRMER